LPDSFTLGYPDQSIHEDSFQAVHFLPAFSGGRATRLNWQCLFSQLFQKLQPETSLTALSPWVTLSGEMTIDISVRLPP
jgi:hypothetical protein